MTRVMENIRVMFKSEIEQNEFISLCSLEFSLTLVTLSNLLGMNEEEVYKRVVDRNPKYNNSMQFQIAYSDEDQELAKQKFMQYFYKICIAYSKKDIEEYKRLLRKIKDADFFEMLANKKDFYTDEEIIRIVKYKLSNHQISELCNIADSNYRRRISKLLEKYPKLQSKYQALADNFYNTYNGRRKNG